MSEPATPHLRDVAASIFRERRWLSLDDGAPDTNDTWSFVSQARVTIVQILTDRVYVEALYTGDKSDIPTRGFVHAAPTFGSLVRRWERYTGPRPEGASDADLLPRARSLLPAFRAEPAAPAPPYDDALDVYLRSRRWWSYRRWLEEFPSRDFIFDTWRWGPHHDTPGRYLEIMGIGDGQFQIVLPAGGGTYAKRDLPDRESVIQLVPDLEQLMYNAPVTY